MTFLACRRLLLGALLSALYLEVGCSRINNSFVRTQELSPVELFQKVSPSVFVVEALDETGKTLMLGSGVALARDSIITNCHVVQSSSSLKISRGKENWTAKLIEATPDHDLCELRPSGLALRHVDIRLSSKLATGEHVYAIGSPEGLELTFSEGVISAIRDTEGVRMIQTSAPTSPGSSGGGLFDVQGNLIGITTFQIKEGQSLNFALPGEWIETSLDGLAETSRKSSHPSSDTDLESAAWLGIGLEAMKKEDYDLAGHSLRKCADLKRADASRAFFELGRIYEMATGLNSPSDVFKSWVQQSRLIPEEAQLQAIGDFERAIELKQDYAEAWLELARVYAATKQYEQAIAAAKEATRLSPGDWLTWFELGNSYYDTSSYSEAIRAYQQADKVAPDKMKSTVLLCEGRAYEGKKDREQVMRIYQELKASDASTAEVFFRSYVLPQPNGQLSKGRSKRDRELVRILQKAETTDEIRQTAWDAFHAAVDRDDLVHSLDAIALSNDIKRKIWDLKFGLKPWELNWGGAAWPPMAVCRTVDADGREITRVMPNGPCTVGETQKGKPQQ